MTEQVAQENSGEDLDIRGICEANVPMDKVPLWTHVHSCLCAQHRGGGRHGSAVFKWYCLSPVECLRFEEMVRGEGEHIYPDGESASC